MKLKSAQHLFKEHPKDIMSNYLSFMAMVSSQKGSSLQMSPSELTGFVDLASSLYHHTY